jgi:S-adenosyl-L-methionine hydrolase (adenosine-forming)
MDLKKNLITLTTDFGGKDYFAGSMKGVILGINPDANIVDVSHDVVSHDIWGATYLLASAYRYFPPYTIHIVVVDPGVGSQRRPIIVVTDRHYFIAPDNGVLSFIYDDPGFSRVIHITADHYFLPSSGSTFHARDIFAPCAAWLSKGVEADKFGELITDYTRFNMPACRTESDGALAGEVVYIDKFGNSITNISFDDIREFVEKTGRQSYTFVVKDKKFDTLSPFYASVPKGEAGVVVNGNGKLEIFINQGDARKTLGLRRGEKVSILFE